MAIVAVVLLSSTVSHAQELDRAEPWHHRGCGKAEAAPPDRRGTYLIIGWALGEAAALFGVVQYMGGGNAASMGLGLMTFVFTLVLLPIPRARR